MIIEPPTTGPRNWPKLPAELFHPRVMPVEVWPLSDTNADRLGMTSAAPEARTAIIDKTTGYERVVNIRLMPVPITPNPTAICVSGDATLATRLETGTCSAAITAPHTMNAAVVWLVVRASRLLE